MKEAGFSHWTSPNIEANNESGFTALPGGDRYDDDDGAFDSIGSLGFWWSSTQYDTNYAWRRTLYYYFGGVGKGDYGKGNGISVRCLRD